MLLTFCLTRYQNEYDISYISCRFCSNVFCLFFQANKCRWCSLYKQWIFSDILCLLTLTWHFEWLMRLTCLALASNHILTTLKLNPNMYSIACSVENWDISVCRLCSWPVVTDHLVHFKTSLLDHVYDLHSVPCLLSSWQPTTTKYSL